MSKRTSESSGCIGLMTETSSLTFLITTDGESWIMAALGLPDGCPTNSGRSCMSICNPKNPAEVTAQLRIPTATVLAERRPEGGVEMGGGRGAGDWPADGAFVVMWG